MIHFHRWGRWTKPFKVACVITDKAGSLSGYQMVQDRTCSVCEEVDRRDVGAPKSEERE